MTSDWVTAIATAGTFVVIAASAVAALMQIRHMRSGNAISLLTAYNNEFDTQEFQLAFNYVRSVLPGRLKEDAALDALAQAPPFVDEFASIRGLFPGSLRRMPVDQRLVERWRTRRETHVG